MWQAIKTAGQRYIPLKYEDTIAFLSGLFHIISAKFFVISFTILYCSVQHPSKGDAGEYKCSVKNKWGTDYTTFQLG